MLLILTRLWQGDQPYFHALMDLFSNTLVAKEMHYTLTINQLFSRIADVDLLLIEILGNRSMVLGATLTRNNNNQKEAQMLTVNQLLQNKGFDILTIDTNATVFQALEIMAEHSIGSLIVMDNEKVVGLFSERDYARSIVLKGRTSKETKVKEIMTSHVAAVSPEQSVEECMAIMTDKRVRHLPVMKDEKLVGIISIGDLVKTIIEEQQFMIEQLVSYINA
jgi:CBS domain-containing protein